MWYTTKECLANLSNLGLQVASWDPLLIHLLVKKMDKTVHAQYEQSISNPKEVPTISHFLAFLETHFHTLEAVGVKEKTAVSGNKTCALTAQLAQENRRCISCKRDSHPIYRCKEFILLSPTHRLNLAQRHKLCVNCFKNSHLTKQCPVPGCCHKCGKRHHTLVHLESPPQLALTSIKRNKSNKQPSASAREELEASPPSGLRDSQPSEHVTSLVTTPESRIALHSVSRPFALILTNAVPINQWHWKKQHQGATQSQYYITIPTN